MASKFGFRSIFLVLSATVLFGCAQEAANKPDANSSATRSLAAPLKPSASKPQVSSRQTPGGSSLDALREGKRPDEGPMKNVYFEFDSYALSGDARAILKANATWLKANPSSSVEIEGHCDERGAYSC